MQGIPALQCNCGIVKKKRDGIRMLRDKLTRSSCKHPLLSHLLTSFLSRRLITLQATFPANLYIFRCVEAVILMIVKGRSPNLRHVSRTHRGDLDWLFERINLDSSIFIRYVRITEQLADMLTKCAFATIQWRFLMQLFDLHPHPKLNVDRMFSETSCSAVSPQTPRAKSDVHNTQRDFENGSWKEKL